MKPASLYPKQPGWTERNLPAIIRLWFILAMLSLIILTMAILIELSILDQLSQQVAAGAV